MDHLRKSDASTHDYDNGAVKVTEFNFEGEAGINDAIIILVDRYPHEGYSVNDISLALLSVESGAGTLILKGLEPQPLEVGDRLLIHPGEAYALQPLGELSIRYIAAPAWTPAQSRIITEQGDQSL